MSNATDPSRSRGDMTHATRERRVAVVDAFIDLMLEDGTAPTPEEVAERGGVSRATFFRYFASLGELRDEAVRRIAERFPDLLNIPDPGNGSLDDRIRRLVDTRVRLHETLHPIELLSRARAIEDSSAADFVDAIRQVWAEQARRHFDDELRAYGPSHRDDIVASISVLTSVESWQQFRQSHGRTPLQTRRAWRRALARILTAPPGDSANDDDSRARGEIESDER